MQLLTLKTRVWYRASLNTVLKYGYITEIKLNNLSAIEENGLFLVTLCWSEQGYLWGKDPNPELGKIVSSDGWADGWIQ